MSAAKVMLSGKEKWGNLLRESRILLPLVVGVLADFIYYLLHFREEGITQVTLVVMLGWTVLVFLAVSPFLCRMGKDLENKGEVERGRLFSSECNNLLTAETLGDLCSNIAAMTSNPAYPLEFYQEYHFWHKIFGHNVFSDPSDIEPFYQVLKKVEFPELLPIAWEVMLKKLVRKNGVFHFRENAEDWLHLIFIEENRTDQNLDRFRQVLHSMREFPSTLSGCLNFSIQNPVFSKVFDLERFVSLINAQILKKFSPKLYFELSDPDKILYEQALDTLDKSTREKIVAENREDFTFIFLRSGSRGKCFLHPNKLG